MTKLRIKLFEAFDENNEVYDRTVSIFNFGGTSPFAKCRHDYFKNSIYSTKVILSL